MDTDRGRLPQPRQPAHGADGARHPEQRAHAVPAWHRRQDHPLAGRWWRRGAGGCVGSENLSLEASGGHTSPVHQQPPDRHAPCTPPPQESELCASLVPNSELVLIEGGDHNFTQPAAAEAMIQAVVDFVLSK